MYFYISITETSLKHWRTYFSSVFFLTLGIYVQPIFMSPEGGKLSGHRVQNGKLSAKPLALFRTSVSSRHFLGDAPTAP